LPVVEEPLQVWAVLELEVLSPPHASGDRFVLHYSPSLNGAPDCLVLLLDVQRGLHRLLLLQQQLLLLQRQQVSASQQQQQQQQQQELQEQQAEETARRTPKRRVKDQRRDDRDHTYYGSRRRQQQQQQLQQQEDLSGFPTVQVWMDGKYYPACIRSVKPPAPSATETARSLLAAAAAAESEQQHGLQQQQQQQQQQLRAEPVKGSHGPAELRRLALASALWAVVGSEAYPFFVTDAIPVNSSSSSSSSSREAEGAASAASDAAAWRYVASIGFEALEVQYLPEEGAPGGPPEWLSPWEVDFAPGPLHAEEQQLQQLLQQHEFPRQRQLWLLQQLETLMATPADTSSSSSSSSSSSNSSSSSMAPALRYQQWQQLRMHQQRQNCTDKTPWSSSQLR
ncbi:hypothetical protein ETH_00035325, partial [Eimeria tenella]